MAISAEARTDIIELVVTSLKHAPGTELLSDLVAIYEDSGLEGVASALVSSPEFTAIYPTFQTAEEFGTEFLANLVPEASAAAVDEGVDIIEGILNGGGTREEVIMTAAAFLSSVSEADPSFGDSAALFNNWVEVAEYHTLTSELAAPWPLPDTITSNDASVAGALAAIDAVVAGGAATLSLSVAQDNVTGTTGDDVIGANVVQNGNGEQTNQLGTGDRVDGLGGDDTLNATIQAASALNNSPSAAITPITVDVENAMFTVLDANESNAAGLINAKSMWGVNNIGSVNSDTDLVVYNLTTLTDSGVYEDRRNTSAINVKFDHSGNFDPVDEAADLEVYFDNDYLLAGSASVDETYYWMLDRESDDFADEPLQNIDRDAIVFSIDLDDGNGPQQITVAIDETVFEDNFVTNTTSVDRDWDLFTSLIQAEIDAGTNISGDGITDAEAVAIVQAAQLSFTVSGDPGLFQDEGLDDLPLPREVPAMVLSSAGGAELVSLGFANVQNIVGQFDIYGEIGDEPPETTFDPIEVGVMLNKVGRGAEGGELTIGGMATDGANEWDFSESAIEEGVQVFNVTVMGDETQNSSLAAMQSTNNTLTGVNLAWMTDSLADVYIGNSLTTGGLPNGAVADAADGVFNVTSAMNNALKDVRDFTAANNNSATAANGSTISTDVYLSAYLSDEVVQKYMDLTDDGADPVMDNADFVYSFGGGNDSFNLSLSATNLEQSGNTAREDFTLTISGGDGDDSIVTQIGDTTGDADDPATGAINEATPWYFNNLQEENLSISGGTGDDTIHTNGSGTWQIDGGADDDTVYSDNSGLLPIDTDAIVADDAEARAHWVFNTIDQDNTGAGVIGAQPLFGNAGYAGLTSATPVANIEDIANLQLTVTFRGLTATVDVGDTASSSGGIVNDLIINNAIKDAINNDPRLSKLISANDGTGRTLIVKALVDGDFTTDEIGLSLSSSGVPTATQTANGAANITGAQQTALGFTAGTGATALGRYDDALADDYVGTDITGADSVASTDSTIDAGTGEDVVVLSTNTDGFSSETVDVAEDVTAEADLVFNATNATITYDILDTIITSGGIIITSGNGTMTVSAPNTVATGAGDDTIVGSDALADTLDGGAGADTYTLGADAGVIDTVVIASGDTGITPAEADTITDFVQADDLLDVDTVFAPLAGVDGTATADFTAFVANADGAYTGNAGEAYVEFNATGSGNAWVAIDENGNSSFDAGDTLIILEGFAVDPALVIGNFI